MADRARRVESGRVWRRSHLRHVIVLSVRINVSLFARRRRDNCEPNNALARPLLLKFLHVAAHIVLLRVWATVVVPLKDHKFSVIIREMIGLVVARSPSEVRRGLADF